MKQTVLAALTALVCLSSCSSVTPSPALQAQASATTKQLLKATVYCPPTDKVPYWHRCGSTSLTTAAAIDPGMGGNIIPGDFWFNGSGELFGSLGKTFVASFPSGTGSKFYVNNLLLVVDEMDSAIAGAKAEFSLKDIQQLDKFNYSYEYYGDIQTIK